jgi:hypothetical protein
MMEIRSLMLAAVLPLAAAASPDALPTAPPAEAHLALSHIQRLNTRGGLAPTGICVNQQSVRVAYTADYHFFRSQP